jgi:hypothetical protein
MDGAVAFLKFSRDRRGYEHFYLVQPSTRGKARSRLLYWFRTPPNIKVGRSPFDPEMRRALEAQNPDIAFDWETIVHTPIPPPVEPERWRERRRVERALRAEEAEEADSVAEVSEPQSQPEPEISTQAVQAIEEPEQPKPAVEVGEVSATAEPVVTSNLSSSAPLATSGGDMPRQGRRRRRRRGRRRPQVQGSQAQGSEPESSEFPKPAIQDSGDPGDEEP